MLPFPLKKSHATSVEEPKDTGGQFKQGQQMRLQPISSDVQNAERNRRKAVKIGSRNKINNINFKNQSYEKISKEIEKLLMYIEKTFTLMKP